MIIERFAQTDTDVVIPVQLLDSTGLPAALDAGAKTVTIIAPNGTAVTGFTAPAITEPNSDGWFVLSFASGAANKAFTVADAGEYTVHVASSTSGVSGSRAVSIKSVPSWALASQASVDALPTLAEMEAGTFATSIALLKKYAQNKKTVSKSGAVWSLVIYDNDGTTPLLTKALKDKDGSDITDLQAGVIAQELA